MLCSRTCQIHALVHDTCRIYSYRGVCKITSMQVVNITLTTLSSPISTFGRRPIAQMRQSTSLIVPEFVSSVSRPDDSFVTLLTCIRVHYDNDLKSFRSRYISQNRAQ